MIKKFSLFALLLFSTQLCCAQLLILGDSLSAGYNMRIEQSWPALLKAQLAAQGKNSTIINASVSGMTSSDALARLPALLEQYKPDTLLIELGANDGLRGFNLRSVTSHLEQLILLARAEGAQVLLMQIELPPNYGKRYTQAFSDIYPKLSKKHDIPLLPFFLKEIVVAKPHWLMADGLHPTQQAQPWIASFMAKQLAAHLN